MTVSELRCALLSKGINPNYKPSSPSSHGRKQVSFSKTPDTPVQKMTDMTVYSNLKLPEFSGTSADFHSWKKASKTEFEGILNGTDFLTNESYCLTHIDILKVLVSRIKKSLKKGASAFMDNVPDADKDNVARVWSLLSAKYDKKTSRASRIIKYWQQMVDLAVSDLEEIPKFVNNFENLKASLRKEKLDIDKHDYPIIVRGHLLRSIRIDAFDERHDKLFQEDSNVTIQALLEELTNFYDTKIAKEEAYSSREGMDTPRKSGRTESSTAGGESPYSKTKNGSSFPKLPRDTLPVMGKMLYDRLNSWQALVMKHNYRSLAENKRLKSNFFDGISVKAYSTKTPDNDPSGKGSRYLIF